MQNNSTFYAQVIVPLPLEGMFSYIIPWDLKEKAQVGCRVIVPFGPKKIYTGIIAEITEKVDTDCRELFDVLDDLPVINAKQLKFFNWLANYYMCAIGEVVNAALPAALKLSSESYIALNQDVDFTNEKLAQRELVLLNQLKKNDLSIKDAGKYLGVKYPQKIIKRLNELGLIDLFEKVKDKYTQKKITKVKLNDLYLSDNQLEMLINGLGNKSKQQDVLMAYLKDVLVLGKPELNEKGLLKNEFLAQGINKSSYNTLKKKGVFEEWKEVESRLSSFAQKPTREVVLSEVQQRAFDEITQTFETKQTTLLHGITGSGKTEIYTQLIQQNLANGKQVLLLLPEIALTTQMIGRLAAVFGNSFGIYHSKYSDNERVEVWDKVLNGEYQFVVGVRSGIFLPFDNLGLIIVDEEHEFSYKQFDPAPRYHARDAAIYLSILHNAKTLLGTATPAFETYQNALSEKFGLVKITERFGESKPPNFILTDVLKQRKQKKLQGNFTQELIEEINKALEKKEQVIIFQNRRGYSNYVECQDCSTIPKCPSCAVSLTYHMYKHSLTCHYCGFHQSMLSDCTHCGSTHLKTIGFGTEEIEEELGLFFPNAVIQRMDLDTTRSKNSYSKIIGDFEQRKIDILVGTQMVSKGLDFGNVNLVGIIDADKIINFPDFRSHEKAFQMLTQVSGRAGRKSKNGKVIIQTSDVTQELLGLVIQGNYGAFYSKEILERQSFCYPPYFRLIKLTFKHREKSVSFDAANVFYKEAVRAMGKEQVGGVAEPMISKLRNQYLHTILIKLEKGKVNLLHSKNQLKILIKWLNQNPAFRQVRVVVDVDAY